MLDFVFTKTDGFNATLHEADGPPLSTADLVKALSDRLRQLEQSELPIAQKTQLTATVSDALLRAINVDVLEKRLEALENVFANRKENSA